MRTMRGQQFLEQDYASVERQLRELFFRALFKPLVDLLSPYNRQVRAAAADMRRELRNADFDPIVAAIRSGRIQYVDDVFTGEFSAAISRALRRYGARFNKQTKAYAVLPQQLPVEVLEASAEYAKAAKDLHDALGDALDGIQRDFAGIAAADPIDASVTIKRMDSKFNRAYGDALGTEGLSDAAKARLNKEYVSSLTPYINEFSNGMIGELREMVAENAREGYRFDSLVGRIQNRYSVSLSKAAFLARNETSRFISKHRMERFEDAGVTEYVWQTAGDTEVRPDHKKLNGRTFKYTEPPVVDESTGRRANAGEDYNCRCVANPILPGVLTNA